MIHFEPFASSSSGNAYRVSCETIGPILLDCGLPFRMLQRATNHQVSSLAGVLLTHAHGDHAKAVKSLLANAVDCYASEETWTAVFAPEPVNSWGGRLYKVKHAASYLIGQWRVMPFNVRHDKGLDGVLGYIVTSPVGDRLVYATDCAYFTAQIPEDTTVLAIECNYDEKILKANVQNGSVPDFVANRIRQSHLDIDSLIKILRKSKLPKLEKIFLLHLSDSNSSEADFVERITAVTGVPVEACKA